AGEDERPGAGRGRLLHRRAQGGDQLRRESVGRRPVEMHFTYGAMVDNLDHDRYLLWRILYLFAARPPQRFGMVKSNVTVGRQLGRSQTQGSPQDSGSARSGKGSGSLSRARGRAGEEPADLSFSGDQEDGSTPHAAGA